MEVKVISFCPSTKDDPLFTVYLFPSAGGQPKELPIVGSSLLEITILDGTMPFKSYKLVPAFVHGEEVIFGAEFWDPKRDGGQLVCVPPCTTNPKRYAIAKHKQGSVCQSH